MIFNRWFKPKWQHKDAAVRQQVISTLDPASAENKKILHELAFNDGSETVRRMALLQLNEFSLWWQASKHDASERLKQFSEQQLITMLLENQVSANLKQQFISQCNRSSILEQLAVTETDADIKFGLLLRLDKNELILKSLTENVLSVEQKKTLLDNIDDEKVLDKLSRQLDGELAAIVQQKLQQQAEQKELPQKTRKQVTLLLAQLNSIRDRLTLADIPQQLTHYQQQWQQIAGDLASLGEEAAAGFAAKYQRISQQLQQWLEPKLAELKQQQAEKEAAAQQSAHYQSLQHKLVLIRNELNTALVNVDLAVAEQLSTEVAALQADIESSKLDSQQKQQLNRTAAQLNRQLAELPQLAEKLAELTRLLADWAAQSLPETAEQYQQLQPAYDKWHKAWRSTVRGLGVELPEALQQSFSQLEQQWQQTLAVFKTEAEKGIKLCRNKLAEFRRLYVAGKYKVLFGLFKGIDSDYQKLNAQQQQQLLKDYEFASSKLAELTDWQEYIATPRKQELVQQAQQLAAEPVTDAKNRAAAVKQLRATWNTLGKAEAGQDAELNAAFDTACETAFEPCREYFAKLDAQRAEHTRQREQIIVQLQQAVSAELSGKALESEISRLTQSWQKSGAVDNTTFSALQQQYQSALKVLKQQLKTQQQHYAELKQQLIAKATAATQLDDNNLIAKALKECQQEWKTIGFAGKATEQSLWQQFRQLCDGFFNARSEQFQQQQQAEQQEQQQLEQSLLQLAAELEAVQDIAALSELESRIRQLLEGKSKQQQQPIRVLLEKLKLKQQQLQHYKDNADLRTVFDVLATGVEVSAEQLPALYRESFNQLQEHTLDRQQLTLALEIVAGLSSPQQDAQARQQVQLLLLSDKHNQGEELTKEALFKRWLQFGAVADAEQALLQRVKDVFSA